MTAVYIALPAFGQICTTHTTGSIVGLLSAFGNKGISYGFGAVTYPNIAELRNMLLTIWYDCMPMATHMLFIDADMSFKPDLVLDMLAFDKPLVGALYRKKKMEIDYVGRGEDGPVVDGFMKVEGIGGGVMLIRRDCVDNMLAKAPQIIDPTPIENHNAYEIMKPFGVKRMLRPFDEIVKPTGRVSEDLSFCLRHLACDGEVWANVKHQVGHVGLFEFRGAYGDVMAARSVA